MFTELLGDATLGGEKVLEVGLGPVTGDVHTLQQQRQPALHLLVHGFTLPVAFPTHLQCSVQEGQPLIIQP